MPMAASVSRGPLAFIFPLAAALAVLVSVTLIVAWALEDIIYFSLFVGIPAGALSGAATYIMLRVALARRA